MSIKKVALYFAFGFLFSVNGFAQPKFDAVRSELYFTDPEKLPKYINSEAEEVFLLFSRDSSTLYFVRANHPENEGYKKNPNDQDIWYTRKDKTGKYEDAKDFHQFNNAMNNGVVGMSLDGNTIYLLDVYNKRHPEDKGICVARKKGGSWGKPEKLDIPGLKISGDLWGFYVNPQETIMILSYKGPDSMGEEDLYVILKEADDKGMTRWGKPKSLGSKINTTGFEFSPYLSEDGYTLFWSTNGRGGEGDADIFASFRTDEGWLNWSEPVNMGPKINSKGFDAYFIISSNDAWWASDRDGAASDIFHARAIEPEPVMDTVKVDTVIPQPPVVVSKEIPKLPAYIEVKLFFAKNSSMLEPDAKRVADSVITIMKKRPEVVAEIHSHADKRASDEYNTWLTQRRANKVVEYMVLMGIDKKRLTANWYGKTKLAVECDPCTEEQHRESRRTVIKLSRIE
ncbi:MAG TPA: OmpA family protein [Flavobacteriales bacterium]|nr:OmpA family protein [Flavobacteriales bacterium]